MNNGEINCVTEKPEHQYEDLVYKAARFGLFGWIAFFIVLFILVIQNIVYAFKPDRILASENGVVVGEIAFDEAKNRDLNIVTADIKTWVSRCTSVNKISIYEDLAVCLTHMDKTLSEERLAMYEKTQYAIYVEKHGCERTETEFDDKKNTINRDRSGLWVESKIFGYITCTTPGKQPVSQEFNVQLTAKLTQKSSANNLGFKVTQFEDINE